MLILLFKSSVCRTVNTLFCYCSSYFKMLLILVIVMEEEKEHMVEESILGCFPDREMVRFSES